MLLAAAGVGYAALVCAAYFQLTPASALLPDLDEFDRLIYASEKPVSTIERLLEAGGDRMDGGGSMRPAFTVQSLGWEDAARNLSAAQNRNLLAEREGERLALLDWVRSGASRTAYAEDDYRLSAAAVAGPMTSAYRLNAAASGPAGTRVRIRTLIADRCVTCHGENGRHDTARFIPLDSYEQLEPRLRPQPPRIERQWIVAALGALVPLAVVAGAGYWHTSQPLATRWLTATLTAAALAAMLACWLLGRTGGWWGPALAVAATLAAAGTALHALATLHDLFSGERAS